ncbi:hypothetical protein PPH41_30830, partial [Burkholderia gladioli]|nr:hypothetical protein [Burkholderia gladioli]
LPGVQRAVLVVRQATDEQVTIIFGPEITVRSSRDFYTWMPKPDARTALQNLAIAFDHYNESHPHSVLKYCSPREFLRQENSPT